MGRLDGKGNCVCCSPGFLAQAHARPGVCSPPPALLSPAWICHHRAGALWIWPQAAPTPVFLSRPQGTPFRSHLNLSGKPFWLSSGWHEPLGQRPESPSLPVASCPGSSFCKAVWRRSLWIH